VNGRIGLESSAKGRLVEANPSRRKSTITIVPSTTETVKKWATWTVVKAHAFLWMNTAHDQDCNVSKSAVMDCKFTSLDVPCLLFVFVWLVRYRLFSRFSNASVAAIASQSMRVRDARLLAYAFRLARKSVSRSPGRRCHIEKAVPDFAALNPGYRLASAPTREISALKLSSGPSHTIITHQPGLTARAK